MTYTVSASNVGWPCLKYAARTTAFIVALIVPGIAGRGSQPIPASCLEKTVPKTSSADVAVYFGCGCFWHMQHAFVTTEKSALSRPADKVSSRCAYAGGTSVGSDCKVCYHNLQGVADYADMGHAEVVSMIVPIASFGAIVDTFWKNCWGGARQDPQDVGGGYRSVIGLPGGMQSPLLSQVQGHAGASQLVGGSGGEADTLHTGVVYVYDSTKLPAFTAEQFQQFHDDMSAAYGSDYNAMKSLAQKTQCPGDSSFLQRRPGRTNSSLAQG